MEWKEINVSINSELFNEQTFGYLEAVFPVCDFSGYSRLKRLLDPQEATELASLYLDAMDDGSLIVLLGSFYHSRQIFSGHPSGRGRFQSCFPNKIFMPMARLVQDVMTSPETKQRYRTLGVGSSSGFFEKPFNILEKEFPPYENSNEPILRVPVLMPVILFADSRDQLNKSLRSIATHGGQPNSEKKFAQQLASLLMPEKFAEQELPRVNPAAVWDTQSAPRSIILLK